MAQQKHSIDELKNNPLFQLSLSSKELFHSNFLVWLAEDPNTGDVFQSVLKLFGYDSDKAKEISDGLRNGQYMALREYKNFDFCICEKVKNPKEEELDEFIPGRVLFILENKFKSIPYTAQLKAYHEKVEAINEEGKRNIARNLYKEKHKSGDYPRWNEKKYESILKGIKTIQTKYVLLSLAESVCGLEIDRNERMIKIGDGLPSWRFISYKQYAETIQAGVYAEDNCLSNLIIREYASFILSFTKLLVNGDVNGENALPSFDNILDCNWEILSCRDDFKQIRMDDIWQKLVANIIGLQIQKQIKETFEGITVWKNKDIYEILSLDNNSIKCGDIIVGVGFSRGTALLDVKLKLDKEIVFGIQIQGNTYKRLLEVAKSDNSPSWDEDLKNFSGFFRIGEQSKWKDAIQKGKKSIFENDEEISPKPSNERKGRPKGFGGYGNTFICQSKQINCSVNVKAVLYAVIADIKRADKVRKNSY